MADKLIIIASERLEPGMYVAELDRSWLETPFAETGMLLTNEAQIETLRRCCDYVYVDPERSDAAAVTGLQTKAANGNGRLAQSRAALDKVAERLAAAVRLARRQGRLDIGPLKRAAELLVHTVIDSRDACLWILQLHAPPQLLYRRALGTAIYAVLLGLELGLKRRELREVAIGGLLLDIGKTAVPVPILAKPEALNEIERHFVRRHVPQAIRLLRRAERAGARVLEMVQGHHERLDGSGYPRQLRGTEIPLYARMAAIADSFDALTLDRRYAPAISPHDSLRLLNGQRDRAYDAALVREFIHALGVYPTGTRVQLTDGSRGLVCRQDPDWPLRPQVLVTELADGGRPEHAIVVDAGMRQRIAAALPPAPPPPELGQLESAIAWH